MTIAQVRLIHRIFGKSKQCAKGKQCAVGLRVLLNRQCTPSMHDAASEEHLAQIVRVRCVMSLRNKRRTSCSGATPTPRDAERRERGGSDSQHVIAILHDGNIVVQDIKSV